MTTESALIKDRDRGAKAKALLDNPLLTEAAKQIEAGLVEAWLSSPARDNDARERIWQAAQTNRKYLNFLGTVMANGGVAAKELEAMTAEAERRKRFGIV